MTGMADEDPAWIPAEEELARQLEGAWQSALRLFGCVECSRVNLIQRLRFMALNKNDEIMGPVPLPLSDNYEPPVERDGIRRVCESCRTPPRTLTFFKPGTDEINDFKDVPDE